MTNDSKALPEPLREAWVLPEVLEVLRELKAKGHKAYLVGGCVRDLFRGKPAKDFDVATSARAEAVQKLFRRVIPTGIKHGTVTVLKGDHAIEVTTFRGEGAYHDGRRPSEVFFLDDVTEDLARRDFTMNAMAWDPVDQAFVDPFGGALDLEQRTVRCVGDPHKRFGEDGLRPLRAVRFASVLGFEIHPETFAAIAETLPTFHKIAHERVKDELVKLLNGGTPSVGVRLLKTSGLLARILPGVDALEPAAFVTTLRRLDAANHTLLDRLAALLHELTSDAAIAALELLRFPNKETEHVGLLLREKALPLAAYPTDGALRKAIARAGKGAMPGLLALARADLVARSESIEALERLMQRVDNVLGENPPLATNQVALDGKRVGQILGKGPGPHVGRALRYLLDKVLDDPSLNTPEALEALLKSAPETF